MSEGRNFPVFSARYSSIAPDSKIEIGLPPPSAHDRASRECGCWRDRQKLRLELVALADVDRENLVFQPGLFQKHRDLVAVRRGPVMEIDHGVSLSCCGFMPGIQIECANWMRLHGLHRIMNAKSMAGVSHPGELICNTA